MRNVEGRAKSNGAIVFLTIALLILLLVTYAGVMRAVIDVSVVATDADRDQRDTAYAYLHLVMLIGTAMIGFLAGKWFNGLGVAFATLFVVVMLVGMLGVQMGSYELACHGHNELIRRWQC